jgi:hypothetical protein
MNVYPVGPDHLSEYDALPTDRLWVVYWYCNGGYDGSGLGAALKSDGNIEYSSLDHCSCYGPTESWGKCVVSVEEFLSYDKADPVVPGRERSPQDYDYQQWQAVVKKVRELVA